MIEPEVAIAFTADAWVESLHRHLTDHGGARVRTLVVEPEGALDESYDVLLAGHRWSALTRALVADVHVRGRAVVGVYDREESASQQHLRDLGVDAIVESDAGSEAFVRAIVSVAGRQLSPAHAPVTGAPRSGRVIAVGGPPGSGRTELAIELSVALARRTNAVLVDADDVAPSVAARLQLPIEPGLRTAIDAVEHGRGELAACVVEERTAGLRVLAGLPSASAWSQVRPGEVVRVVDRLAAENDIVVVDGAGLLEDVQTVTGRGRFATARTVVAEADVVVTACDPSPHGVGRLLTWIVEARSIAPVTPTLVIVNRAPSARFRRGELFEEITATVPLVDVVFVPSDARVADASWNGTPVGRGAFTRAVATVAERVLALPRRSSGTDLLAAAS